MRAGRILHIGGITVAGQSEHGFYVLRRDSQGRFFWNLVSAKGRALLTSESFPTKAQSLASIDACRAQSPLPGQYRVERDKAGSPYFVLLGPDGTVIGRSDAYPSVPLLAAVILAARAYGLAAILDDHT
jgi:uncharacterized protein YegP (UPF0339 family)